MAAKITFPPDFQTDPLFYDNSISELNDSPDFTRMITRRSMCLIALAFLSGELNLPAFWFLNDARQNLNRLDSDLNGIMLLTVNMVELYTDLSWKYASKGGIERRISQYQDDLKNREKDISDKNFIAEYNRILIGVEHAIRVEDIYSGVHFEPIEPSYPGGIQAMSEFIQENLIYPKEAQEKKIEGSVIVCFIIEKDGSVTQFKIYSGIGSGCDEEAIRIIKMMPKWNPEIQRGKVVRSKYCIPIEFSLYNEK